MGGAPGKKDKEIKRSRKSETGRKSTAQKKFARQVRRNGTYRKEGFVGKGSVYSGGPFIHQRIINIKRESRTVKTKIRWRGVICLSTISLFKSKPNRLGSVL